MAKAKKTEATASDETTAMAEADGLMNTDAQSGAEASVAPVSVEAAAPRAEKPVFLGKYAGTHEKLAGEIPTDFKYLNVELFPGHPPKGYLRSLEPQKEGAKVRKDSVFTVIYKLVLAHYQEHGKGITGKELLYAMHGHDWRGTNSPYCEGGTPTYVWMKDYIIGAARPKDMTVVLKESDIPKIKAAPASSTPAPEEATA